MNEIQIDITDINISYTHLYKDDRTAMKTSGKLAVNYTLLFKEMYEVKGNIIINEGDQDIHDYVENLTINDLKFIIAKRLGI